MSRTKPPRQASRRRSKTATPTHRSWLELAFAKASHSPHPSVKVGAVVVTPDGHDLLGVACNGFADGVRQAPTRLQDGEKSFWIMCAEKRALATARQKAAQYGLKSLRGCRIYSTLDPCHSCADDLANEGIACVYVPDQAHQHHPRLKQKWRKSMEVGAQKLREAKIRLTKLPYGDGA